MGQVDEYEKKALFFLISVPGIGNVTITKLLEYFQNAGEIMTANEEQLKHILRVKQLENFLEFRSHSEVEKEYEVMLKKGISFLTVKEDAYPERLRKIPDPPWGIFYLGGLPEDEKLSVAVIGARDCSEYGKYVAVELGKALAGRGIELISGMARGIDGISQGAAVSAGGSSYAVLGSGVDICYPASNRELYERLKTAGGIISIYPPGAMARAQNFPPRNRIVSGLADVLVVIEGRVNSGTLITVDMALEQGKEVYAVPGRITDRLSDGCNRLIRQGAGVFLSPDSFMEELFSEFEGKRKWGSALQEEKDQGESIGGLSALERNVLKVLDHTPQSTTVILNKMEGKTDMDQLTVILMKLTLKDLVIQKSQGQYALNGTGSRDCFVP